VLGLAGRPGQRRAVRATAVALALLALALGVRDALTDESDAPADVRGPRPVSSVPAAPAPVAPDEQAPAEAPVDATVEQPQEQEEGAGGREAEKAREQAEKAGEKAEKRGGDG
jgi:hypothetical protein